MTPVAFMTFLEQVAPRLGLRWMGFRRVHKQVQKRVGRRMAQLGIVDLAAYKCHLDAHVEEWAMLDAMCRISVSRFYRDQPVFDYLTELVLPECAELARLAGRKSLRVWSAGCASGEEPYSLAIAWLLRQQLDYADVALDVLATDLDEGLLERARRGCYPTGTLRELPKDWHARAFDADGVAQCLRAQFRHGVRFERADLRAEAAEGPFDLVLCRNLAFTYFEAPLQRIVAERIVDQLRPGGVLVVGAHEELPRDMRRVRAREPHVYERIGGS